MDRLADHRLALVVRELQVLPPAMEVDLGSEVLRGHREALHMPSGPPPPPRAVPSGFVGAGPLPDREVERVPLLAVRGERVRDDVVELLVRQDPERMLRPPGPEVDVPVHGVREAVGDHGLHRAEDVRDVLAHSGVHPRPRHVHSVHVLVVRPDVLLCIREGLHPCRVGPLRDHVLDVREVLDMVHPIPGELEISADHIEGDVRSRVAEMAVVVDRGPAHVHPDLPVRGGRDRLLAPAFRVVHADRHGVRPRLSGRAVKQFPIAQRPIPQYLLQ